MNRAIHYEPNRKKCEPRSEFEITRPRSFVEAHFVIRRVSGWYFPPVIKPGDGVSGVTNSIEIPALVAVLTPQPLAPASATLMTYDGSKSGNLSASESASEWVMNE